MTRLGYISAALLMLGLWLPWATLSVGLFGGQPRPIADVNGHEIGSGLLDLPVGWIAAGAGIAGAIAIRSQRRQLALVAAVAALLVTGYSLLAIPGEETATAKGEDVSGLVNAQVGYGWGAFAVTAAAVGLLFAAIRLRSHVASEEPSH